MIKSRKKSASIRGIATKCSKQVPAFEFDSNLYDRFKRFMTKQRTTFFNSKLSQFYGKNFCVAYKPHYNFHQEWQNQQINSSQETVSSNIWKVNVVSISLSLTIMVVYTITIWLRNIDCFFSQQNEYQQWEFMYILALVLQVPDAFLRKIAAQDENKDEMTCLRTVWIIAPNIYCGSLWLLTLISLDRPNNYIWLTCQLAGLIYMLVRAREIYGAFRLTGFALTYENHLKAADMGLTLVIISHYLAVILYEITKIETERNWISFLNIQHKRAFIKYIYSFYFGTTTLFTVGYGDITPQNPMEIVVLIVIQSCGIIMIGYLTSQIGHNLSSVRKGRQEIENQLTLINKMKKYYNMNEQLLRKARSSIIEEKPSIDHLAPEEEKQLLMKFNEELRDQIKTNSSLSIVKNCIFFLCRWSKLMQNSVACKLQNILFSPGEHIYQPEGKERIYIIKMGKVDVYSQRKGNKKGNKSVLRCIQSDLDKEVSDNVYGYTAVISTRPVNLYAISKEYSSAYYIDKHKFLQCAKQRSVDFQYYHEIKSKIDQSINWEALQVPQLQNSKHHYYPTKVSLIRKYKKYMEKGTNYRSLTYKRKPRYHQKTVVGIAQLSRLWKSLDDDQLDELLNNCQKIDPLEEESFGLVRRVLSIDQCKQYTNYLPKGNFQRVIKDLQMSQCIQGSNSLYQHTKTTFAKLPKFTAPIIQLMEKIEHLRKNSENSQPSLRGTNVKVYV